VAGWAKILRADFIDRLVKARIQARFDIGEPSHDLALDHQFNVVANLVQMATQLVTSRMSLRIARCSAWMSSSLRAMNSRGTASSAITSPTRCGAPV